MAHRMTPYSNEILSWVSSPQLMLWWRTQEGFSVLWYLLWKSLNVNAVYLGISSSTVLARLFEVTLNIKVRSVYKLHRSGWKIPSSSVFDTLYMPLAQICGAACGCTTVAGIRSHVPMALKQGRTWYVTFFFRRRYSGQDTVVKGREAELAPLKLVCMTDLDPCRRRSDRKDVLVDQWYHRLVVRSLAIFKG